MALTPGQKVILLWHGITIEVTVIHVQDGVIVVK